MPRTVTIQLAPGAHQIALPDHRKMVQGKQYTLRWEHFEQLGPAVAQNDIQLLSTSNNPLPQRPGVDLTYNNTALPSGFKLGKVELGFGFTDKFKLVKLGDAVNAAAGDVVTWSNMPGDVVTNDRDGTVTLDHNGNQLWAGVVASGITAGNYGWIQIDGWVTTLNGLAGTTIGQLLEVHPTADGQARVILADQVDTVTVTGAPTGGTFTLTYGGQTTAGIAYNATAATVQTAFTGLSSVGAGNATVTGSAGGPYTVTFIGALADEPVGAITASGAGLTGGTTPGVTVAVLTAGYAAPTAAITPESPSQIFAVSLGAAVGAQVFGRRRRISRDFYRNQ